MNRDDRRWHARQISDVNARLDELTERLVTGIGELAEDDYDATDDTRARLREALRSMRSAQGSLEDALRQLPPAPTEDKTFAAPAVVHLRMRPYPDTPLASRRVEP